MTEASRITAQTSAHVAAAATRRASDDQAAADGLDDSLRAVDRPQLPGHLIEIVIYRVFRKAEDIGNLAAFLLAPSWINGETIALDGGSWMMNGGGFRDLFAYGDAEWAEARERIKTRNAADRAQRG